MKRASPFVTVIALALGLVSTGASLGADPANLSQLNWIFDGAVSSSARVGDTLYVGGAFNAVAPSANALPALYALSETTGAVVPSTFPAIDGTVSVFEPDGAGGYFVGGDFQTVAAMSQPYLAHVLANGSLDAIFRPVVNGAVRSIATVGSLVYLVGDFTTIGGVADAYIGAVSIGDGANAGWRPNRQALQPVALLAVNGRVVVRGSEQLPMQRSGVVVAYDADTAAQVWLTYVASGSPQTPKSTRAMLLAGTRLIVAHDATTTNGGLSSLAPDTGVVDASWNPRVSPTTLAVLGSTLYLGGSFTSVAGQPRQNLAAIEVESTTLLPWNPGSLTPIIRIAATTSGSVYVSGLFDTIASQPRHRLAQIDAAGVVTAWVADARPDNVFALRQGPAGTVLLATSLTAFGNVSRNRAAAFDLTTGALLAWEPSPALVADVKSVFAGEGRVFLGHLGYTSVVDAASGTVLYSPQGAIPLHAEGEWVYMALGVFPPGQPVSVVRATMAGTQVDPSWQPAIFVPQRVVADSTTLYFAGSGELAAIDKTTGKVRWRNSTANVRQLAISGDTLYTDGGLFALTTFDARTGTQIGTRYAPGGFSAMTVADGRIMVNAGGGGLTSLAGRLSALTLDGIPTTWNPGASPTLIGGPPESFLVSGNVLIAGGIFGKRPPQGFQGLGAFPLDGAKAPSNLRARPRGGVTEFTWDAPVASPTGYVVEAGLASGQTAGTLPLGNATSFSIAVPAGSYYVRVRTTGAASGAEEVTNEILVTGGCTVAPAPPTNLASAVNGTALSFSWTAPDALVNSYTLSAGSAPGLNDIATVPLAGELTSIAGLVPPGTYFVRLTAANACGASGPSGEVAVTVGAPDPLPAAPTNVTATVTGSTVTLAWTPPSGVVTGYVVEGGTGVGLANIGAVRVGAVTSLAIPGAPPGVYVLRVRALTSAGSGAPSADVVARVP